MMYTVEFSVKAIKSYLKMPLEIRQHMDAKLKKIAEEPYARNNNVQPIAGMKGCYRLRIGNWRVVYEIINQKLTIYTSFSTF